ncbi:LURP-one-related/scramblase family protein [Actinocorallia longicatena]|uniref:LURP-one-related/scramblase family protein n=1 Tax=Actinocorallia longicatena TaxID=111803 RepID=A0ABP6QDM5_9ACTN
MRYQVKDRIIAIGDDSWIEDEQGRNAFLLDGKALRLRQTYELRESDGRTLFVIKKKVVAVRETMIVERDGDTVASVHKKILHLIHDRFAIELHDGTEWTAKGDFLDKEYEIEGERGRIASISRKWLRLRDTYTVDIPDDLDHSLVLAVSVAIDNLAEIGRDH